MCHSHIPHIGGCPTLAIARDSRASLDKRAGGGATGGAVGVRDDN